MEHEIDEIDDTIEEINLYHDIVVNKEEKE